MPPRSTYKRHPRFLLEATLLQRRSSRELCPRMPSRGIQSPGHRHRLRCVRTPARGISQRRCTAAHPVVWALHLLVVSLLGCPVHLSLFIHGSLVGAHSPTLAKREREQMHLGRLLCGSQVFQILDFFSACPSRAHALPVSPGDRQVGMCLPPFNKLDHTAVDSSAFTSGECSGCAVQDTGTKLCGSRCTQNRRRQPNSSK